MFDQYVYVQTVYGKGNTPFDTWLRRTTEKKLFQDWLRDEGLQQLDIGALTRPMHMLDCGCSSGSTTMRFVVEAQRYGLREIHCTGFDPYQEQLATFAEKAAPLEDVVLTLVQDTIESFHAPHLYDLVIASHSLYYVQDMYAAVTRLLRFGRETIIVHHGERGINTVQQAFRQHVHAGPNVMSTADDVAHALAAAGVVPAGMAVRHYRLVSTVDVGCFGAEHYDEEVSNNLMSFFLERPIAEISTALRSAIRAFICEQYPDGKMLHDVSVFVIS